jgi:hypothetical protein
MRFGTWNVRYVCKAGSLTAVSIELSRVGFVMGTGGQLGWVALKQQMIIHFPGNENENYALETGFFIHEGIISSKEGRVCK